MLELEQDTGGNWTLGGNKRLKWEFDIRAGTAYQSKTGYYTEA